MRFSMLVGAGLLAAAAAFVWLRGPSRTQEVVEDAIDEGDPEARLAAPAGEVADEPRPGPLGDLAPAPAARG